MSVFWNQIVIGNLNDTITTDDNDDGAAQQTLTVTNGTYYPDTLRNELLTQIATDIAAIRIGINSTGHWTFDNNGGGNFRLTFSNYALGVYLGFTPTDGSAIILTGANSYTAPRRMRGSLYMNGSGVYSTIREHQPEPMITHCAQTTSLAGVTRTTITGVRLDQTQFELQFLNNDHRYASASGAVGTTYASAAATEDGLTEYTHARDCWWDATSDSSQGWCDGRPVRYFADTFAISTSATPTTVSASSYTTWVFDQKVCEKWPGEKMRPPKTVHFRAVLPAREYIAP